LYFWEDTRAVRNLRATWNELLKQDPSMLILQICHSEGAIVVRNALHNYPYASQIRVAAFAPAAYIDEEGTAGVIHYRSTRDIVPLIDVVGAWKCRDTTVILKPHSEAPWFDHSFDSPTYSRELNKVIINHMSANVR
jgi:alpha-beta hydrolase superfamily lysophospholipase